MREDKSAKPAIFTLHGFIKTQIARLTGFHKPKEVGWKLIFKSWGLKSSIAVDDLRTFLVGSKTDDELCGRRWFYLIDQIRDHKDLEPCHTLKEENWEREYIDWLDKLVKLSVDCAMASFEMHYHRTGRPQYSWSRDDMSEASIAELPEWWFDGTRAKRKLREINKF